MADIVAARSGESELAYSRGVVSLRGVAVNQAAIAGLASVPDDWQKQLRRRDGDSSGFHITFLTKADLQAVADRLQETTLNLPDNVALPTTRDNAAIADFACRLVATSACGWQWVDVGEGRVEGDCGAGAAFRVVLWPGGAAARRILQLPPADFHITLGFQGRDVHDKGKGLTSLRGGIKSIARHSACAFLALAKDLLEAGTGRNVDAHGIEQLTVAALESAQAQDDAANETSALRILCNLYCRAGRYEDSLSNAALLLSIADTDDVGRRSKAFSLVALQRFQEALPELQYLQVMVHAMPLGKERAALEKWLPSALEKCRTKLALAETIFPGPEDLATVEGDSVFEEEFASVRSRLKFPSTSHLKNLGAATRDDKICDSARHREFCGNGRIISVEEKIDGANLGLSLDSISQVRMQNRSKMVNWKTDSQFAGLEQWLEQHRGVLCEILERNNDILFGEWCAARHTVKYTRLPGYFLAFDIFDRRVGRFLSRQSFHLRLRRATGPKIPAVPTVCSPRAFASIEEVEALLQRQSRFADEYLEGVYLRIDAAVVPGSLESYLVDRCKLVRSEFQQAIEEHGSWRGSGKNQLDMELVASYAEESYLGALEPTANAGDGGSRDGTVVRGPSAVAVADSLVIQAAPGKENYPSTPHLPFSPGVNSDDSLLSDCGHLLRDDVVITEKLDGGNCCVKGGQVYARSHAQPATHESFSAVKQLAQNFSGELGDTEIFGENMQAVHSIVYGNLTSYFYVFSARRHGEWLAWDEVVELAERLALPVVPVVFRGQIDSPAQLQSSVEAWAKEPSAVGADVLPEGFVVRRTQRFASGDFSECMAKYVRANHIQTDASWRRSWKKAKLGLLLPERPIRLQTSFSALRLKLGNPREKHKVFAAGLGEVEFPRNFSFLLDDLAVSSTPTNRTQILAMASLDVALVVTLTEESPLPKEWFNGSGVENMFVPTRNYHPPTVPQMDGILEAISEVVLSGKKAMVHCGGGKGRAGTVAACVMMRYGKDSIGVAQKSESERGCMQLCAWQSDELLRHLREERPGSVETERQERFIRSYASTLWQRADVPADKIERTVVLDPLVLRDVADDSPVAAMTAAASASVATTASQIGCQKASSESVRGDLKARRQDKEAEKRLKDTQKRAPKYILMVGLAGSGKSTFSKRLEATGFWVRANQDDLGRKGCVDLVSKTVPSVRQGKSRLVVDRCNLTKRERKEWVDTMGNPSPKEVVCVFFDFGAETCKERAASRFDHPTIRAGGGARIIDEQAKSLEVPTVAEGFGSVEIVREFSDADALLRRYGVVVVDEASSFNGANSNFPAAGAEVGVVSNVGNSAFIEAIGAQEIEAETEQFEGEKLDDCVFPRDFSAWLRLALSEELSESEADSIFMALEVILGGADSDPEALSSAVEVARDSGAELCAAALEGMWMSLCMKA